jgi:hypothetical protein
MHQQERICWCIACDDYEALKATRHESETICQRRLGQNETAEFASFVL